MSTAQRPLVSIITPAYNAARFIRETIRSVQAQTITDWEMIIADDGSKDDTAAILAEESAKDARIRAIRLPGNSGPALARNAAIDHASGRYIAFLDSDDLWLPHKLQVQIDFLTKNDAAFCFSQFRRISVDAAKTGRLMLAPSQVDYKALLRHNVIATLTVLIDRDKTGPFRMVNEGYDDFILWLEILKRGHIAYGIQEDLARYRIVGGSVSSKSGRAAKWVWNIYRGVERLSLPVAGWNFFLFALARMRKHSEF